VFRWLKRGRASGGGAAPGDGAGREAASIGERAVRKMAEAWKADRERMRWVGNGFDWWPGSFRVEVRCFDGHEPELKDRYRLSVRTDFVTAASITRSRAGLLAAMARFSPTYAVTYAPASEASEADHDKATDLYLFSSAYVDAETADWLPQFLARMAILQPINAEIQAEFQADQFGGKPAYGPNGKARHQHKMLDVVRQLYAPAGQKPSQWSGSREFQTVATQIDNGQDMIARARDNGLTIAALVGAQPSMILLRTDGRHPQLGHGLLAIVQLPYHYTEDEAALRSAQLNFEESVRWTDFPQLGSWHPHEEDDGRIHLAHSTFVPNLLHRPNLATNLAYWSLARAQWGCALAERWASPTVQ
jgi:hypothetical protein